MIPDDEPVPTPSDADAGRSQAAPSEAGAELATDEPPPDPEALAAFLQAALVKVASAKAEAKAAAEAEAAFLQNALLRAKGGAASAEVEAQSTLLQVALRQAGAGSPDDEPQADAEAEAPLSEEEAQAEADTVLFEESETAHEAEAALTSVAATLADAELTDVETELVAAAWAVREHAVCRYSGFAVGAAFLDVHGHRFTGANVENASYNLGLCAERVALYHALTHGAGRFVAVAIVTEAPAPTSPCGACRQALWEFAPHAEILLVTRDGHQRTTMRDLLPYAFDDATLRAASSSGDEPPR